MSPLQKDPFQAVRGNLIPSLKLTFFAEDLWLEDEFSFGARLIFRGELLLVLEKFTLMKICSLEPKKSPKLKSGKSTSMTLSFMLIFQRWYSFREGKLCSMVFYEAPPATCRHPAGRRIRTSFAINASSAKTMQEMEILVEENLGKVSEKNVVTKKTHSPLH